MRGYARFDAARLAGAGDDGAPVPRLLGAGRLAFTVDQGADTERYQGITPLEGATLTECAHNYFRQSEQLDTAIVLVAAPLRPARAAALMIQRMPGGVDDDDWHRAVALMSTVREREMLDPGLAPTDVLYRLYHQEGVRAYRRRRLRYACRCSRRRVGAMLTAFSPGDIADMVSDGRITVTCEFCKAAYHFTPGEVAAQGAA
jgi:molecular chaperone Hsp33